MWEVSDSDTRVTLFGTVHALPRGVDWFRPHVVAALDAADTLVLETAMPDSATALLPTVLKLARLPAARPLAERVPEAWRPTLAAALADLKPGPLDWYENWFVALTLANLAAERAGFDPRTGVEAVLSERARMRGLDTEALETAEQQLIYFDALSEADQMQLLLSTLEDLPGARGRLDALVAAWMAGDTATLARRTSQEFERSPMLRRMLVEDRNGRWARWIAHAMKERKGHLFVAVGAGHLAGPGDLVAELEKLGLKAKPVLPPPPPKTRRARRR
jgi:hypothetical protein